MNRHFIEVYIQMASEHMKRSSTSLATKETQTKTVMKHYYTNIDNTKAGEDVKKFNHSHIVSGKAKWYRHYGKKFAVS